VKNKAKTFNIIDEKIWESCEAYLKSKLMVGHVVTIQEKAEARTKAQHRLKWVWMGFLAKEKAGEGKGFNAEEWNAFFKHKFIKGLLISQDERHVEYFTTARESLKVIKKYGTEKQYNHSLNAITSDIKTEWLSVKNMKAYMDMITIYCSMDLGVVLPIPDDLKWLNN